MNLKLQEQLERHRQFEARKSGVLAPSRELWRPEGIVPPPRRELPFLPHNPMRGPHPGWPIGWPWRADASVMTEQGTQQGSSNLTVSSWTSDTDELQLALLIAYGSSLPDQPTVGTTHGTWTPRVNATMTGGIFNVRICSWTVLGTNSTGTEVFTQGATGWDEGIVFVVGISNVNTSTPFVQSASATATSDSTTALNSTLSTFGDATNNICIQAYAYFDASSQANTIALTDSQAFTEYSGGDLTQGFMRMDVGWYVGEDLTPGGSTTSGHECVTMSHEIANEGGGGGGSGLILRRRHHDRRGVIAA